MSVTPSPIGGFAAQFFDNNGVILSGGKIYTYAAGTTTPQASYTSASGVTPHANPIILDSAGRVPGGEIWLTDGLVYKFVIETAASILIGTYDNITGVNSNFVNYTVQEEVITATAGQTVFDLSTINYTPGTNSLTVYIDGVNQYVGDSYLETDSDTVTFTSGVHVGGEVKFTTAIQTTTGAVDASIVSFTQDGAGAVQQTVQTKLEQYVSVKDFGAVGDGVADDTVAIQAALDSGATVIQGTPGETYLVSASGTVSVNSVAFSYCLLVANGTTFDLNGSTVKQANAQNSSVIALNGSTDTKVINGTVDSNEANQTTPATGSMAGVLIHNCTRPNIDNITAINNREYAGRFLKNTGGSYTNLSCLDSYGDGWSFGIDGGWSAQVTDAFIDNIYGENCLGTFGSLEGNSAIFTVQRCQVGKVRASNCAAGIKIQDSSSDSFFDSLTFTGPTNGSTNSGVKVQGNVGAGIYPTRIRINSINSRNCFGNGLFVNAVDSLEIGQYHGFENGAGVGATGSDQYDLDLNVNANGRVLLGAIDIVTPKTIGFRATGEGYVKIDALNVTGPTGVGCLVAMGTAGSFYADDIQVLDPTATMTQALKVTGALRGRVKNVVTNALHSTVNARVQIQNLFNFEVDTILLGSTDVLDDVVQLTNTATSTTVTCGHIWREYVGGASNYFQPIIALLPYNATTAALGNMRVTVTDGSSGTGFSINHATAGASDFVMYKVIGWQCAARASA
jgi:hypothetical protein